MLYQPPFKYGDTPAVTGIHNANANASYVNGDPSTGTEGSYIPCEAVEHAQRELVKSITSSGITPDVAVLEQVAEAMARYASLGVFGTGGGSANAQTVTKIGASVPPKAYVDGMRVSWFAPATNTGATVVNAFGIGDKSVKTVAGAALTGGEIQNGAFIETVYSAGMDALVIMPWCVGGSSKRPYVEAFDNGGTFTAANGAYTTLSGYGTTTSFLRDAASSFSGGVLTVKNADAGLWSLTARVRTATTASWGLAVRLLLNNTTDICSNGNEASGATPQILHGSVSWVVKLAHNDTLRPQVVQTSGANQTFSIFRFSATRLGDA